MEINVYLCTMKEKEREVIVTISGSFGAGKSTMTYMLKRFLEDSGFEVEQIYNEDHPTEENFNKTFGKDIHSRVRGLSKTRKIILQEERLAFTGRSLETK